MWTPTERDFVAGGLRLYRAPHPRQPIQAQAQIQIQILELTQEFLGNAMASVMVTWGLSKEILVNFGKWIFIGIHEHLRVVIWV